MPYTHDLILTFFLGLLAWAAWSDAQKYIIPNRVVVALALLWPLHVILSPVPLLWPWALAMAAVVFVVCAVLFASGTMGGGDAKLLTVGVLWAGVEYAAPFLIIVTIAGLGLCVFAAGKTLVADVRANAGRGLGTVLLDLRFVPLLKLSIPYGVAISAGGAFVALRLLSL